MKVRVLNGERTTDKFDISLACSVTTLGFVVTRVWQTFLGFL